jgi:hypothetical protein
MYVSRDIFEFIQTKLNDITYNLNKSVIISRPFKNYYEFLTDNIYSTKSKTELIIKAIILLKFINNTTVDIIRLDSNDNDFINNFIFNSKHDIYIYKSIIKLIKKVSLTIDKYILFISNKNYRNIIDNLSFFDKKFNITLLQLIISFYLFDNYKSNKNISNMSILDDDICLIFVKNYLNILGRELPSGLKNTLKIHNNKEMIYYNNIISVDSFNNYKIKYNLNIDKHFYVYVNSIEFKNELNNMFDNTFKIKSIFYINNYTNKFIYEYNTDTDNMEIDDYLEDEYEESSNIIEDEDYSISSNFIESDILDNDIIEDIDNLNDIDLEDNELDDNEYYDENFNNDDYLEDIDNEY